MPHLHPGAALICGSDSAQRQCASGSMFSDQETEIHAHIQSSYKCVIKGPLFVFLSDGEREESGEHMEPHQRHVFDKLQQSKAADTSHSRSLLDGRAVVEELQAAWETPTHQRLGGGRRQSFDDPLADMQAASESVQLPHGQLAAGRPLPQQTQEAGQRWR